MAEKALAELQPDSPAAAPLNVLLAQAKHEYASGQEIMAVASTRANAIYKLARVVRAMTRAQVRAQQVIQGIEPPKR